MGIYGLGRQRSQDLFNADATRFNQQATAYGFDRGRSMDLWNADNTRFDQYRSMWDMGRQSEMDRWNADTTRFNQQATMWGMDRQGAMDNWQADQWRAGYGRDTHQQNVNTYNSYVQQLLQKYGIDVSGLPSFAEPQWVPTA